MGVRITRQPAIPKGTYYWSCSGQNFIARKPDTDPVTYGGTTGDVTAGGDGIPFRAPVFLPHGAVITAVEVFGNAAASAETWYLSRGNLSTGASSDMGIANINTEDTSISNATIDNNTYCYWFNTSSLDSGDDIWGARIIYTL